MFATFCACPQSEDPWSKLSVKALAEFMGTFLLVHSIVFSVNFDQNLAALAIGSTLMVTIYAWGHVSGAHYNPAVSTGFLVAGKISVLEWLVYVVTQLVAGIVSAFIAVALCEFQNLGRFPQITTGNELRGLYTEFLWTFLLASVVLNTAASASPGYKDNSFFGLAIGFTVVAGAIAVGSFSGGAFNPAVASGLNIGLVGKKGYSFNASSWISAVLFEFLGGILAGVVFVITEWSEAAVESTTQKVDDSANL
jgi:aquaporin Z